ncbi:unnamed protein product [Mytilus edulis]|uniref:Uncharacterized protein n=1 Tax=Mytilus edulis TaxID=6550 RepID=A0A8S3SWQ7_MYTED|nr:unnamed protein product [Mytilus edulis]
MKTPVTTESQVETTSNPAATKSIRRTGKRDIETMLKSNVDLHDKEEYATLLLWDFAGDEEFFLHTSNLFIARSNLSCYSGFEFDTNQIIDKCYYKNIAEFVTAEIKQTSKRFKMATVIFDQNLECYLQKPDFVKGSCEWNDMQTDYFCDICTQRHDNEWSEHQPVKWIREDLAEKLKSDSSSSVPPPSKTELQDVPDYKIRLQKNYLEIIKALNHDQ